MTVVLDDRRACQVCCCLPWQAKQGALLLCLASRTRSPCKTALLRCCRDWQAQKGAHARLRWFVAACCIAALPGKRQSARARLRSAALLLCLASAKRRPLQWCQLMTQLIFAGHRSAAVLYKCSLDNGLQQCSVSVNPGRLEVLRQRSATVNSLVTGSLLQGIMEDAIP